MTDTFPQITGTSIVPINVSELKPNDPRRVISKGDAVAVFIEIGNIKSSAEMLKNPSLALAINRGIEGYYG